MPFPGALPFMPQAQGLRRRQHLDQWRGVRYYELDEADEDAQCAPLALASAAGHRFLWYWHRPDTHPRADEAVWDRAPGVPLVPPARTWWAP